MMFRKVVFLVITVCLTGFAAKAQYDFRFGFQVSPSLSWMQTDVSYINPNGPNLGLKLGALGEYYFRENYAITGGVGFAFNTGGTLKYDFPGNYWAQTDKGVGVDTLAAGVNLKYNLQYVEIPIGLKMRTREFGYMRYFAEIPVFTFGFRSQARGSISKNTTNFGPAEIEKLQIKEEVKSLALSWGLGAGIEYSVSTSTSLVGGVYFQKLFTDINSDSGTVYSNNRGDLNENSKATNDIITFRLGVIF